MADAGFRHEIVANRNEVHQQAVWGTGLRPPGRETDERYLRSLRDLGWSYRTWHTLLMTLSPVVGQRSLAYGGLRLPEWFPNPPTGEAKVSAGWLQGRTLSTSGRVGSLRGWGVYKHLGLGVSADARGHGYLGNQAQTRPFWNPRIWDSPSEGKGLGGTDQSHFLGSWEVVTNTNHFRKNTAHPNDLEMSFACMPMCVCLWVKEIYCFFPQLYKYMLFIKHSENTNKIWKNKNHLNPIDQRYNLNMLW